MKNTVDKKTENLVFVIGSICDPQNHKTIYNYVVYDLTDQQIERDPNKVTSSIHEQYVAYKQGKYKILSLNDIQRLNLTFANAVVDPQTGLLKGTQGSLDRYFKVNNAGGLIKNGLPVILGKTNEGDYVLLENYTYNKKGHQLVSMSMLKEHAHINSFKKSGERSFTDIFANAKVRITENVNNGKVTQKYDIVPIKGTFNVIIDAPTYTEQIFDSILEGKKIPWRVRVINPGELYGQNYCLINNKRALVEFYDCSQDVDKFPIGQFVSRYYVSTIIERYPSVGMILNGEVPSWTISAQTMQLIQEWLETQKVSK